MRVAHVQHKHEFREAATVAGAQGLAVLPYSVRTSASRSEVEACCTSATIKGTPAFCRPRRVASWPLSPWPTARCVTQRCAANDLLQAMSQCVRGTVA